MFDISKLKFDENGLIPAVVVDFYTREVRTLAYMNKESLEITMAEGRTCFWSRSRKKLWRKGEESGNVQHVCEIKADCDGDALVVRVKKDGPACHTGEVSCFHRPIASPEGDAVKPFTVDDLYRLICGRRESMPAGSYTTYLFEKGLDKILKKVGEECTEVIIGAKGESREETVYELADLCYHALVLMVEMGISPDEIRRELARRQIVDHKVKQEKMR